MGATTWNIYALTRLNSGANYNVYSLGHNSHDRNSRNWKGSFAEVIALGAPATSEQAELIEGYLAHKWGLAASLPGDHPYKSSPP
jgi:hypothetical protein